MSVLTVHAEERNPIDLILLLDTSASMSEYYPQLNGYLTGPFLKKYLQVGDTFHLISFSSTARLEISRRIQELGDVETVIARILLMLPVYPDSDIAGGLNYAEAYAASVPGERSKKIVLVSDGNLNGNSFSDQSLTIDKIVSASALRLKKDRIELEFVSIPENMLSSVQSPPAATAARPPASETPARPGQTVPGSSSPAPQGASSPPVTTAPRPPAPETPARPGQTVPGSSSPAPQGGSGPSAATAPRPPVPETPARPGQAAPGSSSPSPQGGVSGTPSADMGGIDRNQTQTGIDQGDVSAIQGGVPGTDREPQPQGGVSGIPSSGTGGIDRNQTQTGIDQGGISRGQNAGLPLPLLIALGIFALALIVLIIFLVARRLHESPNRAMASASGMSAIKTKDAKMLAEFAVNQTRRKSRPPSSPPKKVSLMGTSAPEAVDDGPLMLSLFVEDQNTAIGRRNIHVVKEGYSFSIGGGKSDFLIFLVPIPPHIADIRFDGRQCTLIPRKPQFFPDIGSGPVSDCIGETIRIVSQRGYELFIRIERYEDPLKALNRLLNSVKVVGSNV
ncbi:MAG: VWA domain-containing protein [Treponema sp.]|nr:VWA domain-containing protein [Treponema sp.]